MKDKVMDALQRFSKAMFIPVLILPIAGILIAVGNLFTNVRLQAVLPFLNNPVTIGFGTLLSGSLNAILGNLGVIFCVGLSVGLANKKKSEAGFISLLAFLVFLNAMNKFMNMRGMLVEGSLSGTGQAMVLGVQVLDMGVFIGLLLGIYCGGMYGGSISAILIHAPGTPAAAATLLDGYPMCKKGQAGKALSVAMFASFCGGVIGALVMTFLSPLVADMAMNFGPGEMFMLAVFGLSVIVAISGKSVAKGLISAFFGMLLCTVGLDPTNGIPRFITTKQTGLLDGFQFIPTLIGLFAVSEVIAGVERIIRGEEHEQKSNEKITNVLPDWKTIKKIWPNILSGGLIGTFIGAIPGAGGDIAVFVSYGASPPASTPSCTAPASPTALLLPSPPTTAAPAAR